jgi:hypothetical protein
MAPARAARTDWRYHAASSRLDPHLFFPVSTSGASLTEIEAARRMCQRCRRLRITASRYRGRGPAVTTLPPQSAIVSDNDRKR